MPTITIHDTATIRRIEDAIGYTFNDKRLLVQVLTRKTYLKIDPEAPDNEVLEFYGDTLMNYHVTNYFMSKYAHMLEDGLFFMRTVEQFTDMRSHYVCNRYLTERIKAMGLARYLRAQNREAELRRDGEKVYADIFESLVGAIYLDSYQNEALIRAFILRQLGIEPKRLPDEIEDFDYDTLLTPVTVNAPSVSAAVETTEPAEAVAEDEADSVILPEAAAPLTDDVVPTAEEPDEVTAPVPVAEPAPVPVAEPAPVVPEAVPSPAEDADPTAQEPRGAMQEALASFCLSMGYDLPVYGETPKNAPNARPVAACTLRYTDRRGKVVKISLNDSGKNLAEATEKAAAKMLKKLEKQAAEGRIRPMIRAARTEEDASAEETVAPVDTEATPVANVVLTTPVESDEAATVAEATVETAEAAESAEAAPATVIPEKVETEEAVETVEAVEVAETTEAVEAVETVETVETIENVEVAEATETVEAVEAVEVVATAEAIEPAEAADPVEIAEQLVIEVPAEATVVEAPQAAEVTEAVAVAEEAPVPKKSRTKSTATKGRKTAKVTAEKATAAEEVTVGGDASAPAKKTATRRARTKTAAPAEEAAEAVVEMIMEPVAVVEEKVEAVEAVAESVTVPAGEALAATVEATDAAVETPKPRTRRTTKKASETSAAKAATAPKPRTRTSRSKKNEG